MKEIHCCQGEGNKNNINHYPWVRAKAVVIKICHFFVLAESHLFIVSEE